MALLDIVKKGSTSRAVTLYVFDNTTGLPKTGLAYNSSGIALWYRREGAAKTSITPVTLAALTTAWASGGFIEIGDGEYRLDVPDAAYATSANHFHVGGTFTGYTVVGGRVRLVDMDMEVANTPANVTQLLGTAWLTPGTAGTPDVNTKLAGGTAWGSGAITAAAIAADAITAAKVADDVSTEIRTKVMALTTASGVVGSGSTTANVVASSVAVGATTSLSADAFKGRIIIFNSDTTTAALRGQAAAIVSHTSGATPTFTVATASWTTAPLTTDTFTVV